MIIGKNILYFELHKTACSHTINILHSIPSIEAKTFGKHNCYNDVPKEIIGDFESKIKMGNVRNPWDWYVSLWAFGCMKKGGLFDKVIGDINLLNLYGIKKKFLSPKKLFIDKKKWEKVYNDANNPKQFQEWLKLILTDSTIDLGEEYKSSSISKFSGLLTYRYLKLYTHNFDKNIANYIDLLEFDKENNFIDIIIKKENLYNALLESSSKMDISNDEMQKALGKYKNKTNRSERKDYQFYYNQDSIELVRKYEKLIIEKYGYKF